MPLDLPDSPDAALALVQQHVPMLLGTGFFPRESDQPLTIARRAYPLYTFEINDAVEGRPLEAAQLTAWEYLIAEGDSVVALAEIATRDAGHEPTMRFATLHRQAYAEAIARAIAAAERLPQVQQGHHELRILRAPSLSLHAIWLHSDDEDLLLTVRPREQSEGIDGSGPELYSKESLTERLRPIAEKRLEAQDD